METAVTEAIETTATETQSEPIEEPHIAEQETEAAPDIGEASVTVSEYGELEFGDKFFDTEDDKEPEQKQENQDAPKLYTDDELKATPYQNWDRARIPAEFQRYFDIAAAQMAEAQARAQQEQQRAQFEQQISTEAPRPITRDELKARATEIAKKALNLDADDELDMYDSDHMAAYQMAISDVQGEQAAAQRDYADRVQFNRFSYELSRQPDFGKFDEYMNAEFQRMGTTPKDALVMFAQRYGRQAAAQYISNMYGKFRQTTAPKPTAQPPKLPVVETSGGNVTAKRTVDLNRFGEMDAEAQANALITMGIV